jgi:hypothetical protein
VKKLKKPHLLIRKDQELLKEPSEGRDRQTDTGEAEEVIITEIKNSIRMSEVSN